MSKESAEFAERLIRLDEKIVRSALDDAVGKWGVSWVLEQLAQIYESVAESPNMTEADLVNIEIKTQLLRQIQPLWKCQNEEESRCRDVTALPQSKSPSPP